MSSFPRTPAIKPLKEKRRFVTTERNFQLSVSAKRQVASVETADLHAVKLNNTNDYKLAINSILTVSNRRRKILFAKLANKEYRDAYLKATTTNGLAHQIRVNREIRGLTQQALADKCGKKTTQVTISRMEDPAYGNYTLKSIFKIASALDLALIVKLVPYNRFVMESANKSIENLVVKSFEDENLINDQALVTISIEKHSSKTQPYILVNHSTEKEVFSTFSNENKFFGVNTYLLT